MLWLVVGTESHEIISCNLHETRNGRHQVWVERVNGKTMKVADSDKKQDAIDVKEAIDYAIENKHRTLRL